jgi:aspartate kinase
MLELAASGAKVMQSRSVEFAKKFGVVFEVRSSFNQNPGTLVKEETMNMEQVVVRGISVRKTRPKSQSLTSQIAPAAPPASSPRSGGWHHYRYHRAECERRWDDRHLFHPQQGRAAESHRALEPLVREVGAKEMRAQDGIAKLSIVGSECAPLRRRCPSFRSAEQRRN